MTAEQLEWLAAGGPPEGIDSAEVITSLARRVLAAEKLVEAGRVMDNALKGFYIVPGSAKAWDEAETAYRDASK